jgi:hypothetical protein
MLRCFATSRNRLRFLTYTYMNSAFVVHSSWAGLGTVANRPGYSHPGLARVASPPYCHLLYTIRKPAVRRQPFIGIARGFPRLKRLVGQSASETSRALTVVRLRHASVPPYVVAAANAFSSRKQANQSFAATRRRTRSPSLTRRQRRLGQQQQQQQQHDGDTAASRNATAESAPPPVPPPRHSALSFNVVSLVTS